ncbi:MAG: protease inhibitor I42 family protein [Nitrospirae bacterium]|nr:protease inhibitor I42 family protein [Nitrospirota bacterium]
MTQETSEQVTSKIIDANAGNTFQITLWEDRTGGHSWAPRYAPDALDLIDDEYRRTVSVDTADFGKRVFTFLAKTPGDHFLVMEHRVGWKCSANNRKDYLIRIHPPSASAGRSRN